MSAWRVFVLAAIVVVGLFGLLTIGKLVESLSADEIMVIQAPVSGKLTWSVQPGIYWQGWGQVTHYPKRKQFWFSEDVDESIKIRFNDRVHAWLSGSLAWEMPMDPTHLTALHTKYNNPVAIEHQLIRTVVEKAVYMTGPMMSSTESAAERRAEILQFIEDQLQNGVYRTDLVPTKITDPLSGKEKTVGVVKIRMKDGQPERTDEAPLKDFGVKTFNLSLNSIRYEPDAEKQIQEQRKAIMQVQIAMAEALQAQQKTITVEQEGRAKAAGARWEQETVKATLVTQAEAARDVAKLHAEAAILTKKEQILLGEGESTRRRLVMAADGALDKKLATLIEIAKVNAEAVKDYQGQWMPQIITGSGGAPAGPGSAFNMMDFLTLKAARDLAIDLRPEGSEQTRRKRTGVSD